MSKLVTTIALLTLVLSVPCLAADGGANALIRVERTGGVDRNLLLEAGVPLVRELQGCYLAVGDPAQVATTVRAWELETTVVDADVTGSRYAVLGLRPGWDEQELAACGEALLFEDNWVLVKSSDLDPEACFASPHWMGSELNLAGLRPTLPPPAEYAAFAAPKAVLEVKPLVQDMVSSLTSVGIADTWTDLIGSSTTRYSTSAGCTTAAQWVYSVFEGLGLSPELQYHSGGHAPNVIGTLPGVSAPDDVYIVIGHLDDLPSSGPAPGADDNASGTAMVVILAQVMSRYRFASTVKFLAVTGEEFGLYGSTYYANQAAATGENILGVLNGDMIAWEGDGSPASENLDLNYDSASAWLGTLFAQAALDYGTGCPVDAFLCDIEASDHAPFWWNGFSAVCGITDNEGYCGHDGYYPYYHESTDTVANCGDPAFFVATVKAYLATAGHLADPLCEQPNPPTGLVAQPDGDNRIALSWSSSGAGFTYEVYRAVEGCSGPLEWVYVGQTAATSFVDTTVSGGLPYGFSVLARDATGSCVSTASACAEATTTGDCLEPPRFAGATGVTDDHEAVCSLTVSWSPAAAVYCGTAATYNVYRSTQSGFTPGVGNRVASGLASTSYTDSLGLVSGTPYYYVVRAVDNQNQAEDPNTVEVGAAPTGPLGIGTWTDNAGDTGTAQLVTQAPWHVYASQGHSGPKVYRTGTYSNDLCAAVTTPALLLGSNASLEFWSQYDIEEDYDKGEVQISVDGGAWTRLEVNYPDNAAYNDDACGFPAGWYFSNESQTTYAAYTASLAAWAGKEVQLRWVLSTDGGLTRTGWWVDDITITNVAVPGSCTSQTEPPLFADGFESGDTSAWSYATP